jgi:hypothetical protein
MAKKSATKPAPTTQVPVEETATTSQDTSIVDINSEEETVQSENEQEDITGDTPAILPPVDEDDELATEENTLLVATGFLKCDDIEYQPGDSFPIDHPEAERLFNLGALVAKYNGIH